MGTTNEDMEWLVIKTWNFGVCLGRAGGGAGKQLCATAMQLLQLLPEQARTRYQATVAELFEQL